MRKSIIVGIVAAVVVASGVATFFCFEKIIKPGNNYKKAEALLEEKDYDAAKQKFADLGGYKDAEEKVNECDYRNASDELEAGNYEEAKAIFTELSDYKDSEDMVTECDYRNASDELEAGNYEEAKAIFTEISDYKNSSEMIMACDYQKALHFYSEDDYESAVGIFCNIYEYEDSSAYVYKMFTELAGQEYIDECTNGINHLSNYIQTQSEALADWMVSYYNGTNKTDSWIPSLNDPDLSGMESSQSILKGYRYNLKKVFTESVIDSCDDDTLSSAYNKFFKLHDSVCSILTTQKAMDYLGEIMRGSSNTLQNDIRDCSNAMTDYSEVMNKLREEAVS